jgi:hypothetical protein
VDLHIEVAGEKITVPGVFVFSIAKSTIEMWHAGAVGLAIIIGVFSG